MIKVLLSKNGQEDGFVYIFASVKLVLEAKGPTVNNYELIIIFLSAFKRLGLKNITLQSIC